MRQRCGEALLAGHEHAIPHDLADLRGARFVGTSETPAGKRFEDRLLKMISGDDEITACFQVREQLPVLPAIEAVHVLEPPADGERGR